MDNKDIEKKYELSFWTKDGDDTASKNIKKLISDFDIKIEENEDVRRSHIAQPIDKESFGVLHSLIFSSSPDIADSMSKELQVKKYALRFMIVKNPISKDPQSKKYNDKKRSINKIEKKVDNKHDSHGAVTNEELEKKLEEILN